MQKIFILGWLLLSHLMLYGQGVSCFDLDDRIPIYSFFAEYHPTGEVMYSLEDSIEVDDKAGVVNYYRLSENKGKKRTEWTPQFSQQLSDAGPFKKSEYLCFNNDIELYLQNWRTFCHYVKSDGLSMVPLIAGEESDWFNLLFQYDSQDNLRLAYAIVEGDTLMKLSFDYEPVIHIHQKFYQSYNEYMPELDFWYDDSRNLQKMKAFNEFGDSSTRETKYVYDDRHRISIEKESMGEQLIWETQYSYSEDGKYIEVSGFKNGSLATRLRFVYF